jgi:hypothetical protein
MPHKIEITDKTYDLLKEFCTLNQLKIGQFTDKLVYDGLMIKMYGDVPFTNYMKPAQGQAEAVKTVMAKLKEQESPEAETKTMDSGDIMFGNQDDVAEAIDKHMGEIVGFKWEGAGGPDILLTRKELIEKENQKEMLKQIGTISASDIEDYVSESKKMQEAALEQVGVPAKVINKITKRRLK